MKIDWTKAPEWAKEIREHTTGLCWSDGVRYQYLEGDVCHVSNPYKYDTGGMAKLESTELVELRPVVNTESAFTKQVGGAHYTNLVMQPLELAYVNLGYKAFCGACFVKVNKYTTRKKDNEVVQLKKARHILDLWIEKAEQEAAKGANNED